MSDWYEPTDKGPTEQEFLSEQLCEPWKPRKKERKTFAIERRYIGPPRQWMAEKWEEWREWHTDRKYTTERAREEALRAMIHRSQNSHTIYSRWEYRRKDL